MSLKKTLFLTEYYPPLIGGSCTMFANRFGSYPPDRIVVVTKVVDNAHDFDKNIHYPIHRIPLEEKGPQGFEWLGLVWGLIKAGIPLAIQRKIEVVQCARPLPEGIAGYVIAKLLLKKLVINFHGEDIAVFQNYKVERFLMKRIIRSAQLNLANSSFTESLIKALGGSKIRTAVIHPGFNPKPLQVSDAKKGLLLRERLNGEPIILTVGRLQRRKGQDNIIRALPEITKHFPEVKYVIVGSTYASTPGLTDELNKMATQLGVSQHVVLVGEVENEELPYYYKACDLFIMPNRDEPGGDVEGFGIVFLEAGFLGKPVIGGNSGGVPDAVQHGKTGLLVDG
ncbi:MAG: glycosyltransferase family 4 protein, partial [Deltaproteobacteria bacterium]|nr:glycosyltransferase family 4 protein [Deltaproteobacteria bacterium]